MSTIWKINCMEDSFPGMWQRWFRHQCVAVGWPPQDGYPLREAITAKHLDKAWQRARKAIQEIQVGDTIIVSLRNHRIGRMGEVIRKEIEDSEWNELVPRTRELPHGEMGRRILVRWDMTVGPDKREEVVALPENCRLSAGELRTTIARVRSRSLAELRKAMGDSRNYVSLLSHFALERALSEYIAANPHHLEDGLTPHPDLRVRENTFPDRTRADVLLLDAKDCTVVVECKQGIPDTKAIRQLRKYLAHLKKHNGVNARGILVHGGSRKLSDDVSAAAAKNPAIEVIQHQLHVEFSRCARAS